MSNILRCIFGHGYTDIPNYIPDSAGIITQGMLAFLLFWLVHFPFCAFRPYQLRGFSGSSPSLSFRPSGDYSSSVWPTPRGMSDPFMLPRLLAAKDGLSCMQSTAAWEILQPSSPTSQTLLDGPEQNPEPNGRNW
jgi:hypothetical protein